ncbi:MAG: fumarate reductase cytochrome b subunit [Motiliproteus sp.]
MNSSVVTAEGAAKSSRSMPARLDLIQSLSGLALGLFMWTHLLLVASILISKDAMLFVVNTMEARFLSADGHGYPMIVSGFAVLVLLLFMLHGLLAMRKFPANWRQYRILRQHMGRMHHADTTQWFWQAATGFVMFFLGSAHIVIMAMDADKIGPHLSADRFVTEGLWPLYLILLFCAELHGAIGMYRLAIKWGVFDGEFFRRRGSGPTAGDINGLDQADVDPARAKRTRHRLKQAKMVLTVFFLTLGLLTFAAYIKIGIEHRDQAGQRYDPM